MSELERALVDLGRGLDWPETPEFAQPVRARLHEPGPRHAWMRPLAAALVVLAVAIGAALLVPQARTSILRFFHLGGVTVERVDRLPRTRPLARLELGAPVSLGEAERRLGFPVLLPDGDRPDTAYYDGTIGGVNLLYGDPSRPRLLVSEFPTSTFNVLKKVVKLSTGVERVTVHGGPGLWIAAPHTVQFGPLPPRLAGNTLIWLDGPLTIRLESGLSKRDSLALARTLEG
jgi:hypothetical protein